MLLPFVLHDLLHDSSGDPGQCFGADKRLETLAVGSLHFLLIMLVEEMQLELVQLTSPLPADLASVDTLDLGSDILGALSPAISHMLLCFIQGLKRLLALRTLVVRLGVALWVGFSLPAQLLLNLYGLLRLF